MSSVKTQEELTEDEKKEQEDYFISYSSRLLNQTLRLTDGMSLKDRLKSLNEGFKIVKEVEEELGIFNEEFKNVINNWNVEIERVRKLRLEEIRTNIAKAKPKKFKKKPKGETKETKGETKGETKDEATSTQRVLHPTHTTHVIQPEDVALKPDGGWQKRETTKYVQFQKHPLVDNEAQKISFLAEKKKRKESWKKWHKKHKTYKGGRKRRRKTKKRRRKTRRKTRKRKTNKKRRRKPKKKHY
jgi:hypothetical protein